MSYKMDFRQSRHKTVKKFQKKFQLFLKMYTLTMKKIKTSYQILILKLNQINVQV